MGVGTSSPAYLLHVETSLSSRAIFGKQSASSGSAYGGWFETASPSGMGVYGLATAATGYTYGVYGRSLSTSGKGIMGHAAATSGDTYGMYGRSNSTSGRGVFGWAESVSGQTYGVWGQSGSTSGTGVWGTATATSGYTVGGHFESARTSGVRYQLTCIGQFAQAIVAQEIQNDCFVIRTDKPHVKVSWRVEAVRNDRWVQQYGYQAEQPKPAVYRGKYLHPELYGKPKELGIHYDPEMEREAAMPVEPVKK